MKLFNTLKNIIIVFLLALSYKVVANPASQIGSCGLFFSEINKQLYNATRNGDFKKVASLIKQGADPNTKGPNEETALMIAIEEGHKDIVQLFIKKGVDPEFINPALVDAVYYRHKEIVQLLLEKGANPNIKDAVEDMPVLAMALQNKDKEIAKLLIEKGADPNTVFTITKKAEFTHIPYLKEHIISWRQYKLTVLIMATHNGDKEIVQLLIEKGADLNAKDSEHRTALSYAIYNGHKEIVQLLLNKGADYDITKLLIIAIEEGHNDIVHFLLDKEPDSNIQRHLLLKPALSSGNNEIAQLLLENGVDPNTEDKYGTALKAAAHTGNAKGVQLLIDWGVEINSKSESARSAFTAAVSHTQIEIVKIFFKYGMDPNYATPYGITPLMLATQFDYKPELAMILIKNKADPNTQGLGGNTALMMATINDSKNVAQILLDNGADPNITNDDGETALTIAKNNGHKEIVQLIESKMLKKI